MKKVTGFKMEIFPCCTKRSNFISCGKMFHDNILIYIVIAQIKMLTGSSRKCLKLADMLDSQPPSSPPSSPEPSRESSPEPLTSSSPSSSSSSMSDAMDPLPLPQFTAVVKRSLRDGDATTVWNMAIEQMMNFYVANYPNRYRVLLYILFYGNEMDFSNVKIILQKVTYINVIVMFFSITNRLHGSKDYKLIGKAMYEKYPCIKRYTHLNIILSLAESKKFRDIITSYKSHYIPLCY